MFRTCLIWLCLHVAKVKTVVMVPVPQHPSNETSVRILKNAIRGYSGYLVIHDGAQFSVMTPHKDCDTLETTTRQSVGCCVAANGGPQSYAHGGCIGTNVENGHVLSIGEAVGFGVHSKINELAWIMGTVTDKATLENVEQFVSGLFGWLVFNNTSVYSENKQVAPRTAVGVNEKGQLLVLVIDGCEKCFPKGGATLNELAELLVKMGAQYAINLDGGGSSALAENGRLVNTPTCLDFVPFKCQRPVLTVVCISS